VKWECPGTPKRISSEMGVSRESMWEWDSPGSPKKNMCRNGSVPGLPKGISVEMGVSRDSQKKFQ